MSDEETISREEALGFASKEAAAHLTRTELWTCASQQVDVIPHSPDEITRTDSNSTTELWKRGCAPWQRSHW
jgi:hypothetical protein